MGKIFGQRPFMVNVSTISFLNSNAFFVACPSPLVPCRTNPQLKHHIALKKTVSNSRIKFIFISLPLILSAVTLGYYLYAHQTSSVAPVAQPSIAPKPSSQPVLPISGGAEPPVSVPVPLPSKPLPHIETSNVSLRQFADKTAADRLPIDFPSQVPLVTEPNDIQLALQVLRDPTDLVSIRNEAVNLLRRSHNQDLSQVLIEITNDLRERERFRSYAIQHLGDMMKEFREGTADDDMSRAQTIRDHLTISLKDRHAMVRSEALLALTRERDPRAADLIRSGLREPPGTVPPDILIRCAKEAQLTDLIPTIRPLAYSENQVVRIAAVNVLAQWKDEASRPAFEEANRSTIARIQRAGELAIRLLNEDPQHGK